MLPALTLALTVTVSLGQSGPIKAEEVEYQNQVFQQWWETDLVWNFDALPEKGSVPSHRLPYSGHDYPDRAGGTIDALRRYDMAFHRGSRTSAVKFERHDVTAFTEPQEKVVRAGLFGLRTRVVMSEETPHWHGHCNGWTAAAIRHAEPQYSVRWKGVVFSPATIKGLLAEIYMYRDNEFLGGVDDTIHPGTLHVVLANWIGRGDVPIGIETSPGKEKWNYPLYAFATSSKKLSDKEVEVKMNANYTLSTRREFDRAQHLKRTIYFHYRLTLNDEGDVVGGNYYSDSSRVDMLWAPLQPVQGGEAGNERGNPHIDVKHVLAIWRASVPEELRKKWWNIDPTKEDRIIDEADAEADPTSDVTEEVAADVPRDGPVALLPGTRGVRNSTVGSQSADNDRFGAPRRRRFGRTR